MNSDSFLQFMRGSWKAGLSTAQHFIYTLNNTIIQGSSPSVSYFTHFYPGLDGDIYKDSPSWLTVAGLEETVTEDDSVSL